MISNASLISAGTRQNEGRSDISRHHDGGNAAMSATEPPDEIARSEAVLAEADELMQVAADRSLTVRLAGSIAVRAHSPAQAHLLLALGRRPYRDIDLMAYTKQKRQIATLFETRGYVLDSDIRLAQEWGVKRFVYEHPDSHVKVDVFFDELVMAHTIDFAGRLELDAPTITVTDLLLTKLQIHEYTANDLIDSIVLLAEHEVGPAGRETIDRDYISNIMRKDWGFYYTTQANLRKIIDSLQDYPALPASTAGTVRDRAGELHDAIERAPKTQRWKMRARVGDRVKWYEHVEDVNR
jgi:hypothetical protein